MIRSITIVSLLALLVLVLYLPSAYAPGRFVDQLRLDHSATGRFWGARAAQDLLHATLDRQRDVRDVAPVPDAYDAPSTSKLNGPVARQMSLVNERLFSSPYFRSLDAMLLLATYRAALALKWMQWLALFPIAVAADSMVRRRVMTLEFGHHNPEVFSILACGTITTTCATVLLLVMPLSVHPALLPLAPVAACTLAARAIASYHATP